MLSYVTCKQGTAWVASTAWYGCSLSISGVMEAPIAVLAVHPSWGVRFWHPKVGVKFAQTFDTPKWCNLNTPFFTVYVSFNKLLLPKGTIPISHAPRESRKSKRKNRREVEDSATWLEAWNRYLCARIAFSPSTALELVKYQTLMVMFFTHHQAEQCINYDDLFRQAAARDPTLRWDAIKEDIYVWAFSKQHQKPSSSFREKLPITSRLGPPTYATTKLPTDRVTHTTAGKEICKRFNSSKCTRGDDCVFAHVCWHQHCQGPHPGKGCTKKPWAPESSSTTTLPNREREKSHTCPLQYTQFKRELKHHPDKSWTLNLLQSIRLGVTLGYEGPRGPIEGRNLLSAFTHPTIVDEALQQECQAGRLLGPF